MVIHKQKKDSKNLNCTGIQYICCNPHVNVSSSAAMPEFSKFRLHFFLSLF